MSVADLEAGPPVAAAAEPRVRRGRPALPANPATFVFSVVVLFIVLLCTVMPGVLTSDDPTEYHPRSALLAPGAGHLLGTDEYGRSIATLLVHGARPAVVIAICSVAVAVAVGGLLGLVSGYLGGWVDMLLGRVIDVLMCFPGVLLALLIAAALGRSMPTLIASVALALVPAFARILRSQVIAVRSRLFVEAAVATGIPTRRIVLRHVLPNALAPVIVLATVSIGTSVVVAASLSYLGVGPDSDVPDWGQLLAKGQQNLDPAWWESAFPGIVLTLTVIAVSLLGDWLRDRLDVSA